MTTNWSVGVGLICAAMVVLMCLPMAVGMIRRRRRGSHGDQVTAAPVEHRPETTPREQA